MVKVFDAQPEAGFTLIELTITAVVLALVVTAMASLFISVEDTNRQAKNYALAVQYEHQLMENARNSPYASLAAGSTDFSSTLPPGLRSPRTGTTTITDIDPTNLKRLDIAISYTEHQHLRKVETSTYIARRGIDR